MTKAIAKNIKNIFSYRERIFYTLTFSIFLCMCFYVFFIQKAIVNVVNRESVIRESRLVSSSLTDLEEKYFSIKNNIDLKLAHSKGFRDAEISTFISLRPEGAVVSRNEF